MPIYKYECKKCGHIFEDLRSFSEPDPDECPKCQGEEVRKLISGGNFVLKGSGWYVTDYAGSPSSAASTSSESASDSSHSASGQGSSAGKASSAETSSDKPAKPTANSGASGANKTGSDGSQVA